MASFRAVITEECSMLVIDDNSWRTLKADEDIEVLQVLPTKSLIIDDDQEGIIPNVLQSGKRTYKATRRK